MKAALNREMFPEGGKLPALDTMFECGRITCDEYARAFETGSTAGKDGRDFLKLYKWILQEFTPVTTPYTKVNSYELKYVFEMQPDGFYITNEEFKRAMRDCCFPPVDEKEQYAHFYISPKSTAVRRLVEGWA